MRRQRLLVIPMLLYAMGLEAQVARVTYRDVAEARQHQQCGQKTLRLNLDPVAGKPADWVGLLRAERDGEDADSVQAMHIAGVFRSVRVREVTESYAHLAVATDAGKDRDYCIALGHVATISQSGTRGGVLLTMRRGYGFRIEGDAAFDPQGSTPDARRPVFVDYSTYRLGGRPRPGTVSPIVPSPENGYAP